MSIAHIPQRRERHMDFVAPEADCRVGKGVQNNWHAVFFTDFEDIGGKQNILALVKILFAQDNRFRL